MTDANGNYASDQEVGKIGKDLATEIFTGADNFEVKFPVISTSA